MSYQTTLERTLEMMAWLSRDGGCTTRELAKHFELTVRSIQRTIFTITMAGYVVEKKADRYKINHEETRQKNGFDIGNLLHFSKEEAWMLGEAFKNIPGNNAIKENLLKKLTTIYGADSIIKKLANQEESEPIKILIEAIQNKKQVIVDEYTMSTTNRGLQSVVIEPIEFASDYSRIWAYFPKQKKNFLLRLSGIHGVKVTNESYKYEQFHKPGFIDIFRGYGYLKTPVSLQLNNRAYGFMLEEFPMAKTAIKKLNPGQYELNTEVCDFAPLARFYLGLPGNIKIIGPSSLMEYVKNVPFDESKNMYSNDFEYGVTDAPGEIIK
jgi:predicted DNA-binding transcriptional regulator YafY